VAVGDFNGDGKQDIAVANSDTNTVSVLLNNGDSASNPQRGFGINAAPIGDIPQDYSNGPNTEYTVGKNPGSLVVGDFNGDGNPDLALVNAGDNTLSVLLGNGSGGFSAPTTISIPGSGEISAIVVGGFIHDFNHPSKQDLAVVSAIANAPGFVSILEDNGNGLPVGGGFTMPEQYSVGVNPISAVVGDFNGDGFPDLAVLNKGIQGGTFASVSVLLQENGTFFSTDVQYTLAAFPYSLAVGDFNGDGHLDIVVAGSDDQGGDLTILRGYGQGLFHDGMPQPPTIKGLPGTLTSVVVGDFNGDGIPDLALANDSTSVTILLGNGGNGVFWFATAVTYALGMPGDIPFRAGSVAVGDFNGDTYPDLVATKPGTNLLSASSLSVLLNQTVATTTSVTASPNSAAYGQSVTFTATVSSGSGVPTGTVDFFDGPTDISGPVSLMAVNGQQVASFTTSTLPVATHTITARFLSPTTNFGGSSATTTLEVARPTLTVTVDADPSTTAMDPFSRLYGVDNPAFTASYSGFVNGDTPASLGGTLTFSTDANASSPVGSYAVTPSGLTSNNYDITFLAGTLNVTPAPLTVMADAQTKVYGSADPAFTYQASGFQLSDTAATVLTGGLARAPGETVAGGPYAIGQGTLAADANYAIAFTGNSLAITPATLTVTADAQTKVYGGADPTLIYSASGFQLSDTAATVLTGSLARARGETVAGDPYAISQGTLAADPNYTIAFTGNSLAITPAALTVTANNAARVYGASNPTFNYTISGFVNGDTAGVISGSPTVTTLATASSAPGNYDIHVDVSPLSAANYSLMPVKGTLTVTAIVLSATGVNFSATAGASFTGTVATFINADPFGSATSYTALITWGDGSTSAGVISGTGSTLTVSGSHTYADPVNRTVNVTISHNLGYTTTATVSGTATVTSLGQNVVHGLTGGIGFWHSSSGQALVTSFNVTASNPSPTALASWLKATFPNLYGSLALTTNADVAAYFQTLFTQAARATGTKTQVLAAQAAVEVLATALNVYATTASLGGTAGTAYGFTVSAWGLGAYSYNVGSDGAAFGVASNTTLTVYALLLAVNNQAKNGVLYGGNVNQLTLEAEAADLFTALNQAGGIG
jgi:hypothetical protein